MSSTQTAPKPNTELAQAAPKQAPAKITAQVLDQISSLMNKGRLHLPADYSAENALASAWLVLQATQDKDRKPIYVNGQLTNVVTLVSVVNALHDMVVQGLNVAKKQGYFIVYGNQLTFQRSYFGDKLLAERMKPGIAVDADVVYEGEEIVLEKLRSDTGYRTVVAKHTKVFPREGRAIIGAYCGATDTKTGEDLGVEIMDMGQIKNSWKKSKTQGPTSFHNEQPDQACLRTVIRRWAKPIINASNDSTLLDSIRRQDEDRIEAEIGQEEALNANNEIIITAALPEPETTSEIEQAAEPAKVEVAQTNPEEENPY